MVDNSKILFIFNFKGWNMKKYLLQLSIFSIISLSTFIIILSSTNGYSDPFYIRFTTPKQQNLILGTSRAAQGLQPHVFKQLMDLDIYNYAFTVSQSPYGPIYLESIKNKLDRNSENGIFIITVDPWSISSKTLNPNDIKHFRENELCVGNTPMVDSKPNFQYLFNNLSGKYADILLKDIKSSMFLHENGWLEVTISMDSTKVKKRIDSKIENYRENLSKWKYSSLRLEYLKKTILFLKNYGKVYLIRLPVHERMMKIENELTMNFDEKIKKVVPLADGYFDMTPSNIKFNYTDGNHLHKKSGRLVSEEIVNWIKAK